MRAALADRVTLSEAIEAVGLLVRRFPNGGANAGKDYIGGLAAVLAAYPRAVALRCHDPLTGVPRDVKFLPTPSDLIAWCERETEQMRKPVENEDRDARILREMRERAEDEIRLLGDRDSRPTYDELKAKHGENWGINQSTGDNKKSREFGLAQISQATAELRRRENIAAGIDPESPISAALLKAMAEKRHVG